MQEDEKKIDSYINNLPKKVQDFIFDGEWQDRVYEISKKYSLNEDQSENLADTVVLVLIGLQGADTFLDTIIKDLGVSRLLAEQIMEDVDKRVFELAIKETGGGSTEQRSAPRNDAPFIKPLVPEIKPDNLPMDTGSPIEKHEILKTQEKLTFEPEVKNDYTQKPVSVPRFTGVPIENEVIPNIDTKKPEDLMNNKLNSVTSSIPQTESPKKYVVDPYREPIE